MRKKCVRRAKPVLLCLTLALAAVSLQWSGTVSAQSTDPLTLPRLSFADFTYLGGFRLPRTAQGDDFSYGGNHMAYNAARNSLFVNSLRHNVAEVSIPQPLNTSDVNQMPYASYLQPFSDPSEGHFREVEAGGPNPAVMAGLLVYGNRLYATGSIYYDAQNSQVVSHFSDSTTLSEPSFIGMSQVWETGKAGYVGGYMATIPAEWQSRLGGPALTGQCCIPIISRTSFGPAAFAWDPATIGRNTAVPAAPLLYYPHDHTTLGPWEGSNQRYGATTAIGGAAVIAGTRTAVFIGRNGLGKYCYGYGVTDPALDRTLAADGVMNCYDPMSSDKGMHAYPYRYQIWAYDLADFAAVKAGTKQPWEVEPYGVWPFDFPTAAKTVQIGGVAYDAQRQLLYVGQYRADVDGYANRAIIHTLKVNVGSSTVPPPLSTISMVSATPDVVAPQMLGTSITWTAGATGGTAPYEYKWFTSAGGVTTLLKDWSASPTYVWQPTVAASDTRVIVWARSAGNTADAFEAKAESPFAIHDIAADTVPSKVSGVTLSSSLPPGQPASTSITWTASPSGGSGSYLYKWFIFDGITWVTTGPWSTSNNFSWTPTTANESYRVAVWVKGAANSADSAEASAEMGFPITQPVAVRVASVALNANLSAPQPALTTITWTATPTGGSGSYLYQWFVFDGSTWTASGPWSSSDRFNWTPTAANANYRVGVWVKGATNPQDGAEASAERGYAISEPVSVPVASVALNANLSAPQPVSSTVIWTATPTGGTGALVYKWFLSHDGGSSWTAQGPWASSSQLAWTPTVANANYRISVWVKRASNTSDSAEATAERTFAITDRAVTSVTLTPSLVAPQSLPTTIQWTAAQTGGTGAIVYKWFLFDGVNWVAVSGWVPTHTFTWTPRVANANYRVGVWAKRASNPLEYGEALADVPFAITPRK